MNKYSIIVKVCETGSISKAAVQLNYTQSAVSQVISSVERELGFPLFRRLRTGVALTKEGKMILPAFQNIAEEEARIREIARSITGFQGGSLCVGMLPSVGRQWMPDIIKEFSKEYPAVEYELMYGITETVEKELVEGRIDCGFMTSLPENSELEFTAVYEDEFLVLLPKDHPLTVHEDVLLSEIAGEPLIVPAEKLDESLADIFSRNQLEPNIYLKGKDEISMIRMIGNGMGIGIFSKLSLSGIPIYGQIKHRWFREHYKRTIGIAVRKNQKLPLLADEFIAHSEAYLKKRYPN